MKEAPGGGVSLELMQISLFEGLGDAALEDIRCRLQLRQFVAGELICREGDVGSSLFIIESGLVHVLVNGPAGPRTVTRLRRGDLGGEMSLITGEPRSATLKAVMPTTLLELRQEAFGSILASYPVLFANLARILSRRLARADLQLGWSQRRGETVALVCGRDSTWHVPSLIESTQAATPREVCCIDLTASLPSDSKCYRQRTVEGALGIVDDLLHSHNLIIIVVNLDQPELPALLQYVDRVFVLATEEDCSRAAHACSPSGELVLITSPSCHAPQSIDGLRVLRTIDPENPQGDIAWLGRHFSRTKIGLALGAGGAKGYAHLAVLDALQSAGYPVDYVAGSSIGAFVGCWLALGRNAAAIEATMRTAFSPENVAAIFKLSFGGLATGADELRRLCYESTDGLSFSDLVIPLVVMAVDLNTKRAKAMTEGPLWEALLAAGSVPGLYPPYQLHSDRLVDAIALVPVPTEAARAAGADVVVSVNLMSWDTLPAWPTSAPPPAARATKGSRMLDTLLEVMDLMQLDCSTRHAGTADLVITPRFGPATWRDFQLADLFLAAGRAAAEEQLPALRSLAKPQPSGVLHSGGPYGSSASVHV
jgi:NTE family protein